MAYGQHGSSAGGGLRKALSWVFYIVFVIGLVLAAPKLRGMPVHDSLGLYGRHH